MSCPHYPSLGDPKSERLWIFYDEEISPGIVIERHQTTNPAFLSAPKPKGEQGDAVAPAATVAPKAKGSEKSKPESEARSR